MLWIAREKIILDGGTQQRTEENEAVIAEYVELWREWQGLPRDAYEAAAQRGEVFPPLKLIGDINGDLWLVDGFHRLSSAAAAGMVEVPCEVRPGTLRDAVLASCSANSRNGLQRSRQDKRRAVLTLAADPEWRKWSDGEIAKRVGVSQPFVSNIMRSLGLEGRERMGTNGRVTTRPPKGTIELDSDAPLSRDELLACSSLALVERWSADGRKTAKGLEGWEVWNHRRYLEKIEALNFGSPPPWETCDYIGRWLTTPADVATKTSGDGLWVALLNRMEQLETKTAPWFDLHTLETAEDVLVQAWQPISREQRQRTLLIYVALLWINEARSLSHLAETGPTPIVRKLAAARLEQRKTPVIQSIPPHSTPAEIAKLAKGDFKAIGWSRIIRLELAHAFLERWAELGGQVVTCPRPDCKDARFAPENTNCPSCYSSVEDSEKCLKQWTRTVDALRARRSDELYVLLRLLARDSHPASVPLRAAVREWFPELDAAIDAWHDAGQPGLPVDIGDEDDIEDQNDIENVA